MSEPDGKRVRVLVRLKHSLKEGEEINAILPETLADFEEMFPGFSADIERREGPDALAAWKRRRRSPRRVSST